MVLLLWCDVHVDVMAGNALHSCYVLQVWYGKSLCCAIVQQFTDVNRLSFCW